MTVAPDQIPLPTPPTSDRIDRAIAQADPDTRRRQATRLTTVLEKCREVLDEPVGADVDAHRDPKPEKRPA